MSSAKIVQPLQRNKEYFMFIGAYWPDDDSRPFSKKCASAVLLITLTIMQLFGWSSSVVFIIKYVRYDPESALYALFQIAAMFSVQYGLIATILSKQHIDSLLNKFEIIHKDGKILNSDSIWTWDKFAIFLSFFLK